MATLVEDYTNAEMDVLALTVSAMEVRDRRELLLLAKRKSRLLELVDWLGTSKRYISRSDRRLLSTALSIYGRRSKQDFYIEVVELQRSTETCLNAVVRMNIGNHILQLFSCYALELENLHLRSDHERFASMVDKEQLFESAWNQLRSFGVVLCNVLPRSQRFEVYGVKLKNQFYEDVKDFWGFEQPERYFIYTGGVSTPFGTLESGICTL